MRLPLLLCILPIANLSPLGATAANTPIKAEPIYLDVNAPIQKRVNDLLSLMTLEARSDEVEPKIVDLKEYS